MPIASISAWASRSKRAAHRIIALAVFWLSAAAAGADTVYLAPDDFLRQTFKDVPQPSVIWLDNNIQTQLTHVLGHRYPQARLRYWRADNKTAWILDEIGKDYPITAGFIVIDNHIERAKVLIYRESRGQEIHLPAFLHQFDGASLEDDKLSKKIDVISGASLSVDAMWRMAQAALKLNQLAP
jgi:hypothetical protein